MESMLGAIHFQLSPIRKICRKPNLELLVGQSLLTGRARSFRNLRPAMPRRLTSRELIDPENELRFLRNIILFQKPLRLTNLLNFKKQFRFIYIINSIQSP